MKLSSLSLGVAAACAGVLLVPSEQAAAQQSASAAAMLEEVIVTARRREESLTDLPLSVAAITADQMQAQGIYDIMDVSDAVPNVNFTATGRRGIMAVFIRGIGQDSPVGLVPSGTGTYIDGHYLPNTVGNMLSTVDVERIEVLRGPQGTLFGKNTTGGAINVVSVKPQQEFGADFLIRAGEFGQNDMRATLNVPFSETVAGRVSVAKETSDGFWYNRVRRETVGATDLDAFSAALRFTPNDNWTIDLSARGNFQDDDENPGQCAVSITPGAAATVGYTGPNISDDGVGLWGGGTGHVERLYPGATLDFLNACNTDVASGDYVTSTDRDVFMELDNMNYNATINWDSGGEVGSFDNIAARLIYGSHETEINYVQDRDYTWMGVDQIGTAPEFGGASSGQIRETDSLEFLLTMDLNDSVSIITGVHLFEDVQINGDQKCLNLVEANFAAISDPNGTIALQCFQGGDTQFDWLTNKQVFGGPGANGKSGTVYNDSIALFGHVTWDISENWTLDFGARWTEDERGFHQIEYSTVEGTCTIQGANTGNPVAQSICIPNHLVTYQALFGDGFYNNIVQTYDEITPMVSASYNFSDDDLFYATISTGFLSGSFNDELNTVLNPDLAPLQSYLPETVTNYEIGYKGTFADGRVRMAASLFYMDYADKQEQIDIDNSSGQFGNDPDINITTNAATVEITGIEFELRASPWDGGFVSVDLGYLDDEYGDYTSFNVNDPNSPIDLSNTSRSTYSAEWTMNASIEHAFQLQNGATLTPLLGLYYQSEYDFFERLEESPPSFCNQEGYTKLRGRLTYVDPSENWQASLYGFNITDERYYEWCDDSRAGTYAYRWGAPEQWGIEFNYSF